MNRKTLEGSWMRVKGKVHEQWGKPTDDDVEAEVKAFEDEHYVEYKAHGRVK